MEKSNKYGVCYPVEYFNPHVHLEYDNNNYPDLNEAEIKALQYEEYKNKNNENKKLKNQEFTNKYSINLVQYQEELKMKNKEEEAIKQKEKTEKLIKNKNFNKTVFEKNMKPFTLRNKNAKSLNRITKTNNNNYIFITKLKTYLESEEVNKNINKWFDLIFGYKQKGKEAEAAFNLFIPSSYDNFDIEKEATSPDQKIYYLRLTEFGLTPHQITNKKFGKRKQKENENAYENKNNDINYDKINFATVIEKFIKKKKGKKIKKYKCQIKIFNYFKNKNEKIFDYINASERKQRKMMKSLYEKKNRMFLII